LLVVIVIIAVLAGGAGIMTKGTFDVASLMSSSTKPVVPDASKPADASNNTTTNTTTQTNTAESIKTSIKELIAAYNADKASAGAKYKGKMVTITGKVASLSATDFTVFVTGGDPNEQGANCIFTSAYKNSIQALEPLQDVTVQGKVGDFTSDITVTDCSFIK
jgi:hypothetical protein